MKSRMEVEVRLGQLTDQTDVEAIVNPTNDYLMLTGTYGNAIRRLAGEAVDREAQAKGQVLLGEAVATSAGALPFKCIIHAAIIGLRQEDVQVKLEEGSNTNAKVIGAAVLNALEVANARGIETLAMPPIGVEDAGFPLQLDVDILLSEISAYATNKPEASLKRVVIVTPTQEAYVAFRNALIKTMAS
jgi:O-acetyl-ADP-ribose deacetylase (regulator of RNase III)